MAEGDYADWLQRGRVHQWEGRPVDAMLCFQRAQSLAPTAADPRYLLGEVQWQLGAIPRAVAAWREAARVAPEHLATQLALAEALLALADSNGAADVAAVARRVAPDDRSARVLDAVAALASGRDANALLELTAVLAGDAGRLASPAIGGMLAHVLQRSPDTAGGVVVLTALVPHLDSVAFALLAPMARAAIANDAPVALRNARGAIVRAALDRPVSEREWDVLREIALALAAGGDHEGAVALASRHAAAAVALAPGVAPLRWPRRTAGAALRVAVVMPQDSQSRERALQLLSDVAGGVQRVAWTLLGDAELPLPHDGPLANARTMSVGPAPDLAAAAVLAAEDPDLLLDLAGLSIASGALLAARPAAVAIGIAVAAPHHEHPLIDDSWPTDARTIVAALTEFADRAASRPGCGLTAAELNRAFTQAVEAHREGRNDEARDGYQRLLEAQPDHAPTLHLSAALLREQGELDAAATLLKRALREAPDYLEARAAAARLERDRGKPEHGLELVEAGLQRRPRSPVLWRVRGELELARHDGAAAAASFSNALALDATDAEANYNLGVALQMQGRRTDAARSYQHALAFDPGFADAHFNLAVLFGEGGRSDASITAFQAALGCDLRHVAAYKNLGEALLGAGRIDEWIANFRRFESQCPDALPLAVQALEVCQHTADHTGLERYLEGLRNERFHAGSATELVDSLEQLLYLLLFFDVEPAMIHRFAQTYAATAPQVYGPPLQQPPTRKPGKLRIGYLSADLRNHVMGKMMWQALCHHDRQRFALHFYSTSPLRDAWTEKFAGIADRFEVIAELAEQDAALRIADDDLDLLVDLSGHTKGGKPGILARKPARVQLTHVASAGSVGLASVDFKLTDHHADLPANQAWLVEQLLPMAGCVYPYRHIEAAASHPFHREALGIARDAVVIGAFVTPMKLSRRCLALWRNVLDRVARARLAFSPNQPALRPVYERLCVSAGIARDRLLFLPQGRNDEENQARYALIDLVLDPMPFGGVNGVLEPLDAGVPVVALLGQRHGERSAYTILTNLGVTQTLAQGGREYVDIAARLADDSAFMQSVRAAIRAGLASSPLVDLPGHARNLEAAYLEALALKAPQALAEASRG